MLNSIRIVRTMMNTCQDKSEELRTVVETFGGTILIEKCNELFERMEQYCNRDFLKKITTFRRFDWRSIVAYYLSIYVIYHDGLDLNEQTKHEYMTKLCAYFHSSKLWTFVIDYEIDNISFDSPIGTIDDSIEDLYKYIANYTRIKKISEQETEITYQLTVTGKHRYIGDSMMRFEIPK